MAIWWQLGKPKQNINKSKTHNATWTKARLAVFECIYNRYIKIFYVQIQQLRLYSEVGSEQERQHWSDLSGAKQRLWPKSFPSGRLCMLHLEQCLANRRLQPQYDSCWWKLANNAGENLRFEVWGWAKAVLHGLHLILRLTVLTWPFYNAQAQQTPAVNVFLCDNAFWQNCPRENLSPSVCATVTGILPPSSVLWNNCEYKIWNRSQGAVEYESLLAEGGHCCKHYIAYVH